MKASVGFITFFMALGVACNMLGSVLAKPLTDRFDKLALFRIINIILGFLSLALVVYRSAIVDPADGAIYRH